MKFLIFLISLSILPVASFACPDLTGQYHCASDDEAEDFDIVMENDKDVTVYALVNPADSSDRLLVRADNKVYSEGPDQRSLRNRTQKAWCEENVLRRRKQAKVYFGRDDIGVFTLDMYLSRVEGTLSYRVTGFMPGLGKLEERYRCRNR